MAGISDVLAAVAEPKKESSAPKKKYIQFSLEEWERMEKNANQKLEVSEVKAIISGVFNGKVNLSVPKPAPEVAKK